MEVTHEILKAISNVYRFDEINFTIEWQDEPEFDDVLDEIEAILFKKVIFIKEENDWYVADEKNSVFCENLDDVRHTIYFMIEKAYTDAYGACTGICFNSVGDLTFRINNITGNEITIPKVSFN